MLPPLSEYTAGQYFLTALITFHHEMAAPAMSSSYDQRSLVTKYPHHTSSTKPHNLPPKFRMKAEKGSQKYSSK